MRSKPRNCYYCGLPMWDQKYIGPMSLVEFFGLEGPRHERLRQMDDLTATREHLVRRCELRKGRKAPKGNIVMAHKFCNNARDDHPPAVWRAKMLDMVHDGTHPCLTPTLRAKIEGE